MDFVEVKIGKELIEKFLKDVAKIENVSLEMEGDKLNLVLTSKVLNLMKIPISVRLKVVSTQETPDDPIVFSVEVSRLIMSFLKDFKGNSFEMKENKLFFYPSAAFSFLERFVIFEVEFAEDFLLLRLRPFNEKPL